MTPPPPTVWIALGEMELLFAAAIERGEFDHANEWAELMLKRNDSDESPEPTHA